MVILTLAHIKNRASYAVLPLLASFASACSAIKPYEKEFLLEPVMSDEWSGDLGAPLMSTEMGRREKLGGLGSGGASAAGTSCPTCGG